MIRSSQYVGILYQNDVNFVFLRFQVSSNNYLYVLDHHPKYSKNPEWVKGDHIEICMFAFGIVFGLPEMFNTTEEEKELSRDMIRYQMNFAKHG